MVCVEMWSISTVGWLLAYTLVVMGLTAIVLRRNARWHK